jgi:DNA mismatch repair ATPase MutS
MKVFLMDKAQDFNLKQKLPAQAPSLMQDLALDTLFNAMAQGDPFLFDVAKQAVLSGLQRDLDSILYRQPILKDCLKNSETVRAIYALAVEAIESERKNYWGILSNYPDAVLSRSRDVLQMFVGMLKKLKRIADEQAEQFASDGFRAFFAMLHQELSDDYFVTVQNHLKDLEFRHGVLISAELGKGNKGMHYVLRKPHLNQPNWLDRLLTQQPPMYTFYIADRDVNGAKALSELKERGIHLVATALAQANDHILSFFSLLRIELGFYIGCLNLHTRLTQLGEPIAFPVPVVANERRHTFEGLYDVCLALTLNRKIVGNDVRADKKDLVVITGANQGGKSTFLRSIGLAQLMMQCGMFVPAVSFCANLCTDLFTHYKREEDTSMQSGKLDEELSRMSAIVDKLTPNAFVLFNESFAATNEREGSEIARQIVSALVEKQIKVYFVTHLYEFAHGFFAQNLENALFLRAQRRADGGRSFKVDEGEPLQTSYGVDVYQRIFGAKN